jgi:predicted O-linked N-acetylglucosamine transferase (SPINDLY family)
MDAGRFGEARPVVEEALRIEPGRAEAWLAMGLLAMRAGAHRPAAEILAKALALAPEDIEARTQYARALQLSGRMEAAGDQWRALCERRGDDAYCWESLGIAEQAIGETEAADTAYRRALALRPSLGLRAKLATLISPIIASQETMLMERQRMSERLDALLAEPLGEPVLDDPMRAALWTNFYLAYHGLGDRELQEKTAAMYRRVIPSLDHVAEHCRQPRGTGDRIRVGLISQFFSNHSIGRTSRGFFAQLDRDRFEVHAIFIAPTVDDDYARFIRQHAEHSLVVPQDLATARQLIEALRLDVLFYQDIGMEPFSYFLAYSRLARVQCLSFGHPDTTGIPAMDYFVSNYLFELPGAEDRKSVV